MAKAQEMLAAYNLEMHDVTGQKTDNKRNDKQRKGGLYTWQRKLWKAVAEMNFCYYLSVKGLTKGSTYEHRLIGSHANVIATELMAEYLQTTIEKWAQRWAKEMHYKSVFVQEAIAYREGMTFTITGKLQDRRAAKIREAEELKAQEAARAAQGSTSHALTIVDIISSEADFNNDYLNNWELGTTAHKRHEAKLAEEAWMREYEEKKRVHNERMANDPAYKAMVDEQAAKSEAAWKKIVEESAKKAKRRSSYVAKAPRARAQTAEEKRQGLDGWWDGRSDAKDINVDDQIDNTKKAALK